MNTSLKKHIQLARTLANPLFAPQVVFPEGHRPMLTDDLPRKGSFRRLFAQQVDY